mgnify:CR=1 FL=1
MLAFHPSRPRHQCHQRISQMTHAPIISTSYTNAAKGQPCTFRIAGVVCSGTETTVFAHIRDQFKGMGNKASDLSGADACFACHAAFDGQGDVNLSKEDWQFYALRGIQETIANRVARGFIIVKGHNPLEPKKRRKPKQKMRKVSRPIQNRGFGRSPDNTRYLDEDRT